MEYATLGNMNLLVSEAYEQYMRLHNGSEKLRPARPAGNL